MPQVKQYTLTIQEKDLGLTWQEVIETWDAEAALKCAERKALKFAKCDWFDSIIVRDDDGVIATITVLDEAPQASIKYHRIYKQE